MLGFLRRDGAGRGQMVPVWPAWLAQITRRVPGYTRGAPVILIVSDLGRPSEAVDTPKYYVQQFADLLGARVMIAHILQPIICQLEGRNPARQLPGRR